MTGDFAVVGTDTGVGKTVVTAGLVGMLRDDGVAARAVKPCQTGFPPDDVDDAQSSARRAPLVGDAAFVADACGTDAAATCLRRLEPPLAPEVAARQSDTELSYEAIREECQAALAETECGVVEGIGGLRVPLADGREVIDLVADLDLPAVVVARSGLGTLNHTALTVEALRRREVPVLGVVLSEYEGDSVAERTNPETLADMTGCRIETLPPLDLSDPAAAVDGVCAHLSRSLVEGAE